MIGHPPDLDQVSLFATDDADVSMWRITKFIEILTEPRPAHRALHAYLDALPTGVVCAVMTLMCAGRDGIDNVLDHYQNLPHPIRRHADAVHHIAAEPDRMKHIDSSIEKLEVQNIDEFFATFLKQYGFHG